MGVPKAERGFPQDIEYIFLIHLLRGFSDAQASCSFVSWTIKSVDNKKHEYNRKRLAIRYNNAQFLNDLYSTLVKYNIVKGGRSITNSPLRFQGEDVLAIEHLIYNMDWTFTEEHGLYLDSKKELFERSPRYNLSTNLHTIKSSQKIDKAINLLLEGEKPFQIAQQLSYANVFWLYNAFKKETGQTIGKFRNSDEFHMLREIHQMRNSIMQF